MQKLLVHVKQIMKFLMLLAVFLKIVEIVYQMQKKNAMMVIGTLMMDAPSIALRKAVPILMKKEEDQITKVKYVFLSNVEMDYQKVVRNVMIITSYQEMDVHSKVQMKHPHNQIS